MSARGRRTGGGGFGLALSGSGGFAAAVGLFCGEPGYSRQVDGEEGFAEVAAGSLEDVWVQVGGGDVGGRGRAGLGRGEILVCGGVSGECGGLNWGGGYFSCGIYLWADARLGDAEAIGFWVCGGGAELYGGGGARGDSNGGED